MLATANSGKTFHSEIRLIQPPGATARKVSPAFPFFEIRREAIQRGEGSPALNCKFDPDRSSALSRHQPSIRSYPQRRIRATSRSTILPSFYLLFPVALCRLEKLIGDRIDWFMGGDAQAKIEIFDGFVRKSRGFCLYSGQGQYFYHPCVYYSVYTINNLYTLVKSRYILLLEIFFFVFFYVLCSIYIVVISDDVWVVWVRFCWT